MTKLTLTIDDKVAQRAKAYAKQREVNLSGLVEAYLEHLTAATETEPKLSGVVAELAGVLKDAPGDDWQEDYTDYLYRKYQ